MRRHLLDEIERAFGEGLLFAPQQAELERVRQIPLRTGVLDTIREFDAVAFRHLDGESFDDAGKAITALAFDIGV